MEDVSRLAEASAPRESSPVAERARATFASTSGRDDRGARSEKRPRVTGRRRREDEWSRDRRARRLASVLAPRLGVGSAEHARDVLVSMVLCECAAKSSTEEARAKIAELQADLPPGVVAVRGARLSGDHVAHRYLVADGPGAVYLAFAGTQDARDLLTDAAYLQTPLRVRSSSSAPRLMVHRGFAARARATRASVAAAWRAARALGKRLVLCGHSLGGAVAALAALTLLLELDHLDRDDRVAPQPGKTLLCAAFAAPPVGDESTRRYVERRGWTRAFINVCAPEDAVPRLLLTPGRRAAEVTSSDADADAADGDDARAARDPSGFVAAALSAGRSLRPEYAHLVPPHRLHRGGRVVLAEDDDEPAGSASLRFALIRHTMRAHRARVREACANAFPDPRDRSGAAWRETTARTAPEGSVVGKILPRRRFEASARSVAGKILALPAPVGDANVVPAPIPRAAGATIEPSGRVLAVVVGDDLDLCGRVTADVRGWPCVASVSSSSATRLVVYVSPPTFNGRALPAEDAGGADADGWRPLVLALGGDFGDARVAVRVVDERVDAETLGTALDGALESGGDEGAGGILRRWFGGIVRSRL